MDGHVSGDIRLGLAPVTGARDSARRTARPAQGTPWRATGAAARPRPLRQLRSLAALALLAVTVSGCSALERQRSSARLDHEVANALARQLDSIERRFQVGGGACNDITGGADPNTTPVREAIARVRDAELRDALTQSFDHLFSLVREQCVTTPTVPEVTTPEVTEPAPTDTATQPSETSTRPETTPTPQTQPTQPGGGAGAVTPTPGAADKAPKRTRGRQSGGAQAPDGASGNGG